MTDAAHAFAEDPRSTLELLANRERRLLLGVRHHSPACAAAIPQLLDEFEPDRIFVELPTDFQAWVQWLGHPELEAPVALAGVRSDGGGLSFYPFADFSPELAAIRWATKAGVPVEAFDLPVTSRAQTDDEDEAVGTTPVTTALAELINARDSESLWDQLVEARAVAPKAEATRRGALLYGWALRLERARTGGVSIHDLQRETFMRACLAARGRGRVAVVVGAFHAAALVEEPLLFDERQAEEVAPVEVVTSLIPYSHDLLDSRSGYPAGIRDPNWQQRVWATLSAGGDVGSLAARAAVEISAQIREQGHIASVPDAREVARMAADLARLRALPAPGRRELLESVESCLGRGQLLGRGRVLARALDRVLVGRARGQLAPGTPRSGLLPHVVALLQELRLPGPGSEAAVPSSFRLDPLRSRLDRRRLITLERLAACGVPYGTTERGTAAGGIDTLTRTWSVAWRPATEAMLELAGTRGVTLEQAASGMLRAEERRLAGSEQLTPAVRIDLASTAAACGLGRLVTRYVTELAGPVLAEASLSQLLGILTLFERIRADHEPGLPLGLEAVVAGEIELYRWPLEADPASVLDAAVRALEGISGSTELSDARALLELVRVLEGADSIRGLARVRWVIAQIARQGSPLMQGAAAAVRASVGPDEAADFGDLVGSWIDGAVDRETSRALAARLRGALVVAAPLFEAEPEFTRQLIERVESLDHSGFLARLPALREGFEVLSPAARDRLLDSLTERLGIDERDLALADDPALLSKFAAADDYARGLLSELWEDA